MVRALAQSGRAKEITLYTGNDDKILVDLLTRFALGGDPIRIAGGRLGHWAVWTKIAALILPWQSAISKKFPVSC